MNELLAATIGVISPPPGVNTFGAGTLSGFNVFLTLIVRTLITIAGIYSLFNFILAGYSFMSAGDDPKNVEDAWKKIYQTIIGLAFVAGSFVLAAIIGQLLFKDTTALLQPRLTAPAP